MLDSCIAVVLSSCGPSFPTSGPLSPSTGPPFPPTPTASGSASTTDRSARSSPTRRFVGHRSAISTRKGGGFYGYKIHAAVDVATGLPLALETHTARDAEVPVVPALLDKLAGYGIRVSVCIADRGYDAAPFYDRCEARGIRPVAPLRETPHVKAAPPSCEHGVWTFAGSDAKRGAAKYRCPSGECSPASIRIKADRLHTLIPRETARWKDLYRSRVAVERNLGRLKHEWALLPLRIPRIERVSLHVDLTILAQLASALADARAVPSRPSAVPLPFPPG